MRMKILSSVSLLLLSGCGRSSDKVVEYYIEEDPNSGNARGVDGTDESESGQADGSDGSSALTFVSPTEATDGGSVLTVVVTLVNIDPKATWSLYFATSADATDGTPIAEDLSVETTTADWDTTDLAPGQYHLYATLSQAGVTERYPADAVVTVAADGTVTNAKPQVKITVPNGEDIFVTGTTRQIMFTGQDADGDELTYKVEYSVDNGATWTLLDDSLTGTSYDWNITGLAQGVNYRVRVTASDGNGGTSSVVSAKAFGVATQPVTFAAGFGTMLQQRCGNCHAAGRPNAGQFRSDSFDLADLGVSDMAETIKASIEDGTMPPAGPLGVGDKALLKMWIWGGSP